MFLSMFLFFGGFQPGCSYKRCSYKKKGVCSFACSLDHSLVYRKVNDQMSQYYAVLNHSTSPYQEPIIALLRTYRRLIKNLSSPYQELTLVPPRTYPRLRWSFVRLRFSPTRVAFETE